MKLTLKKDRSIKNGLQITFALALMMSSSAYATKRTFTETLTADEKSQVTSAPNRKAPPAKKSRIQAFKETVLHHKSKVAFGAAVLSAGACELLYPGSVSGRVISAFGMLTTGLSGLLGSNTQLENTPNATPSTQTHPEPCLEPITFEEAQKLYGLRSDGSYLARMPESEPTSDSLSVLHRMGRETASNSGMSFSGGEILPTGEGIMHFIPRSAIVPSPSSALMPTTFVDDTAVGTFVQMPTFQMPTVESESLNFMRPNSVTLAQGFESTLPHFVQMPTFTLAPVSESVQGDVSTAVTLYQTPEVFGSEGSTALQSVSFSQEFKAPEENTHNTSGHPNAESEQKSEQSEEKTHESQDRRQKAKGNYRSSSSRSNPYTPYRRLLEDAFVAMMVGPIKPLSNTTAVQTPGVDEEEEEEGVVMFPQSPRMIGEEEFSLQQEAMAQENTTSFHTSAFEGDDYASSDDEDGDNENNGK